MPVKPFRSLKKQVTSRLSARITASGSSAIRRARAGEVYCCSVRVMCRLARSSTSWRYAVIIAQVTNIPTIGVASAVAIPIRSNRAYMLKATNAAQPATIVARLACGPSHAATSVIARQQASTIAALLRLSSGRIERVLQHRVEDLRVRHHAGRFLPDRRADDVRQGHRRAAHEDDLAAQFARAVCASRSSTRAARSALVSAMRAGQRAVGEVLVQRQVLPLLAASVHCFERGGQVLAVHAEPVDAGGLDLPLLRCGSAPTGPGAISGWTAVAGWRVRVAGSAGAISCSWCYQVLVTSQFRGLDLLHQRQQPRLQPGLVALHRLAELRDLQHLAGRHRGKACSSTSSPGRRPVDQRLARLRPGAACRRLGCPSRVRPGTRDLLGGDASPCPTAGAACPSPPAGPSAARRDRSSGPAWPGGGPTHRRRGRTRTCPKPCAAPASGAIGNCTWKALRTCVRADRSCLRQPRAGSAG